MAKRKEGAKNLNRREKRLKQERKPLRQEPLLPPTPPKEETTTTLSDLNQSSDTSAIDQKDRTACDDEVDVQLSDENGECVDVETTTTTENTDSLTIPKTPTSMPMEAGKTDSDEKAKTEAVNSKVHSIPSTSRMSTSLTSSSTAASSANSKKRKGRRDSGTSSDEERWLTAIESGKLEDVDDELKKIKNPKLMTARQRAMYERNMDKEPSPGGELLMSLPTGYRGKEKPQTAEEIQKAALKSQKRKQQADEKREKDKKKTMERLLKKQETKQRSTARSKSTKTLQPMISYRNTVNGSTLSFPVEYDVPFIAQEERDPPKLQLCAIDGCGNQKVYNCSKTKLPLCSFACYRKNVQAIKQIMC